MGLTMIPKKGMGSYKRLHFTAQCYVNEDLQWSSLWYSQDDNGDGRKGCRLQRGGYSTCLVASQNIMSNKA